MSTNLPSESPAPWRRLYPFASHYDDVGPGRLHYVDEGHGPAVVMLHGNPTWSFMYRDLARRLSADRRVIVPDHLGCGLSDKPQDYAYRLDQHIANLERLLCDELKLTAMDLVVHDWGGAIGFGFAVRHPDAVRRLVVMNTAAFMIHRCPARIRLCRIPLLGEAVVRGCNAFAKAAVNMAVCGEPLTDDVKAGYLAPYNSWANRIATIRFVQDIPLREDHPTRQTLATIEESLPQLADHPMLICWGMRDFCFTEAFLDRWIEVFPDAQVHRFPDAGHYLLEDAAADVEPRIHSFLTQTAP